MNRFSMNHPIKKYVALLLFGALAWIGLLAVLGFAYFAVLLILAAMGRLHP